ncbi:hypothetical protein FT643_19055 [Ketobacter sp. MCCC 1A13808]|uniref:hypothetical protein n=1 Tax=Ketobacter sp. MCCC 1A13808 TaxID=2602738 RepID=UPI0012EC218C|nr:hypothetical protein [Ketobacter sp. MCCC 1A13808]MVF14239.1 hypothetical protein [Ketobacter sp. MCCC 1A13808]
MTTIISLIALAISLIGLSVQIRSKIPRIKVGSSVHLVSGAPVISICCQNDGERPVNIEALRLPLTVWDYVSTDFSSRVARQLTCIGECLSPSVSYVSDSVAEYSFDLENCAISNGGRVSAVIDVEKMLDVYVASGETFGNKAIVLIFLLLLTVEAHLSNGKVIKVRLALKDRLELMKRYLNDTRLCNC